MFSVYTAVIMSEKHSVTINDFNYGVRCLPFVIAAPGIIDFIEIHHFLVMSCISVISKYCNHNRFRPQHSRKPAVIKITASRITYLVIQIQIHVILSKTCDLYQFLSLLNQYST